MTPAQVQAVAAKYLLRNNRTVGLFIATDKPQRVAVPATPDLPGMVGDYKGRALVAAGEAFEPTPENIEARVKRLQLPDGIKVSLLQKKTRGEDVQLTLTLRYGNEENLKDLENAAGFLPELMLRGTKKLSYQQLRDELDRLKATLGSGGGGGRGGRRGGRGGGGGGGALGSVGFSIQAKRDTLPEVLGLLQQVLHEPLLPADQFEVMKRARIAGLEETRTEPGTLAGRLLSRELSPYPKSDIRYIPTTDEALKRLESTSYEQVVKLYHDFVGSQNGELSIVGDFDPDSCLPVLHQMLGSWSAAKPYARITMPAPPPVPGALHKINTPDKANATYTAGMMFPLKDDDTDYPAALMANYILGGGSLSSRLANRIRQQDGLSYSVGSTLAVSSLDKRASLSLMAICNPQNMDRVVKDMREELDRLRQDGVTAEELEKAKQGFLQSEKVRLTTDGALTGLLSELQHVGRTMTYHADLDKKIEGLTKADVDAAARKYFDPDKLVVVVAGDFEAKPATGNESKPTDPATEQKPKPVIP